MAVLKEDEGLVATFKIHTTKNEQKSIEAGRPIYDDNEMCEIRVPGNNDWCAYPAHEISRSGWVRDPDTGELKTITYAERFSHQYHQFKARAEQTKAGTPLDYAPFLTDARRAELRAFNIYTMESLAAIEGQPLKNIGMQGREWKNKAQEYLDEAKQGVPNLQLMQQLEALKARNAVLEEDQKALTARQAAESEFDGMSAEALRDFIATNTGHTPQGTINRKTLIRMAMDARPEKAA